MVLGFPFLNLFLHLTEMYIHLTIFFCHTVLTLRRLGKSRLSVVSTSTSQLRHSFILSCGHIPQTSLAVTRCRRCKPALRSRIIKERHLSSSDFIENRIQVAQNPLLPSQAPLFQPTHRMFRPLNRVMQRSLHVFSLRRRHRPWVLSSSQVQVHSLPKLTNDPTNRTASLIRMTWHRCLA